MEITKPSELREGMKLKGKWLGIPVSGVACTANNEIWFLMPHMARLTELFNQAMSAEFTDLESVEGLMAAKEGDVLVDDDGDEYVIVFANDFIVLLSEHDEIFTWQDIEDREWKLKDQEQPTLEPVIDLRNGHHGSDVCDCINAERLKADTINLPDEIRINGRAYRVWDSSSTDTD